MKVTGKCVFLLLITGLIFVTTPVGIVSAENSTRYLLRIENYDFWALDVAYPQLIERHCYLPYDAAVNFVTDLYRDVLIEDFQQFVLVESKILQSPPYPEFYRDSDKSEFRYYKYTFCHMHIDDLTFMIYVSEDNNFGRHLYASDVDLAYYLELMKELPITYDDALKAAESIYKEASLANSEKKEAFLSKFDSKYTEFDSLIPCVMLNAAKTHPEVQPCWMVQLFQPVHSQFGYYDSTYSKCWNCWLDISIDALTGNILFVDDSEIFTVSNFPWYIQQQLQDGD